MVMTPEISLVIVGESENNQWFIDSGASRHMTPDKKSLENFEILQTPIDIKLADNSMLYIYIYSSIEHGGTSTFFHTAALPVF